VLACLSACLFCVPVLRALPACLPILPACHGVLVVLAQWPAERARSPWVFCADATLNFQHASY
jgi:hypothetical protein